MVSKLPMVQVLLMSPKAVKAEQHAVAAMQAFKLMEAEVARQEAAERVRVQITRHARTHSVGKYQSCMF